MANIPITSLPAIVSPALNDVFPEVNIGVTYKATLQQILNLFMPNITQLGTITSGVWQGGVIGSQYGGTGVNNANRTLTFGGNVNFIGSGNVQFNFPTATNVTFPASGTLATVGGSLIGNQGVTTVYATPGNYTFTTPLTSSTSTIYSCYVVGAGGGSGGIQGTISQCATGGGGAGVVLFSTFTGIAPNTGLPVTVGQLGAGGTPGNNGLTGQSSSIGGAVNLIAGGGQASQGLGISNTATAGALPSAISSGTPLYTIFGAPGENGIVILTGQPLVKGGMGGSTQFGQGGRASDNTAANATNGSGFGAGGGGIMTLGGGLISLSGKNGSAGLVIIQQLTP